MKPNELTRIRKLHSQFEKEYYAPSKGDWSDIIPPSQSKLEAAIEPALGSSPRNRTLLKIASTFYCLIEEYEQALKCIETWMGVDKKSVAPVIRHMQYYFENFLPYETFLADVDEGLKRMVRSPLILWLAYQGALKEGDDRRRLHWAVELAKVFPKQPKFLYICGVELGRNLMFEKAARIFRKALKKKPNHVWCLNGLGQCHLERFFIRNVISVCEGSPLQT